MRNQIDVNELVKVFRLKNGMIERIDHRYSNDKWRVFVNRNNSKGYCHTMLNGKNIFYHNIVWILSTGKDIPEGYELDHINGDGTDNRIENLRLVTHRCNSQNMVIHRNGKLSGFYFNKTCKKYHTQIYINGKRIHIGFYNSKVKARKAYICACKHINDYIDNKSFRNMINLGIEL